MQVLRGRCSQRIDPSAGARIAIELLRSPDQAIVAMLGDGAFVDLVAHPLSWFEIGEQYLGGKREFSFDDQFRPLMRVGPQGPEPYPVLEAVRKIIRGCYSAPSGFRGGSLNALVDALPGGTIHLYTRESGFVGRFCSLDDAKMIAAAMQAISPVIFETPEEFLALGMVDQGVVLNEVTPGRQWPAKLNLKQAKEVYEMAKAQEKTKATKVVKAEASQRRADGPVAKARELFAKMKDKETPEIIKACEALGINKGTATTQLGRWRKENGIVVKRGGARKKGESAKSDTPKADAKAATKGKGKKGKGKKAKSEPKSPGIPKGSSKRHKPQPQSQSASQTSASSPAASSPSTEKSSASSPASDAKDASSGTTAASTSTAASGEPSKDSTAQ